VETPAIFYDERRDKWVLLDEFTHTEPGFRLRVPRGFLFDLASVPRPLWAIIAPHELSVRAALVHDHLYRNAGLIIPGDAHPGEIIRRFTRFDADILFLRMMREDGVPLWRRSLAFLAVRIGGRGAWRGI
jgi:hypothetical protein